MKFIKVDVGTEQVYINADYIEYVAAAKSANRRFKSEIRITGDDDDDFFLVVETPEEIMEMINGETLRDFLK